MELSNTQVFCFCSAHAFVHTDTLADLKLFQNVFCQGIVVRSSASGEKRDSGTKVKAALCREDFLGIDSIDIQNPSIPRFTQLLSSPKWRSQPAEVKSMRLEATCSKLCDSILGINNLCLSSLVDVISLSCLSRSKTQPVTKKDFG